MKKIIFSILLVISTIVFGQDVSYSVEINNRPLIEVLKEIEKKYNLFFSYKIKDVKNVNINLQTRATSINNLLKQLLSSTNLQFEIVDSNFVVVKQKSSFEKNTIAGTVFDYQNKTPLPYANVIVENTTTGVTTDEDGNFELQYESIGDEKLQISYVGYEAQTIEIAEFINKKNPSILLKMPKIKEAFLVITDYLTDGISVENNGAATNIKPRSIGNMPGMIEPDVLSTIQFLPGVSAPTSRASDIYIRGCTPDQNLIIWEDIPVYHTAHYFGMISSINPYIIESTKVYRGGFNATYGGKIGGVIDLLSPNENSYNSNFGIGANMTHAQAYAHQKFKLAESPSSITFSLRRSYNEIFETPTFKSFSEANQQGPIFDKDRPRQDNATINNDFHFLDANFKISTRLNEKNRFQFSSLYAVNDFNDKVISKRERIEKQTDSLYTISKGISFKLQHQWNNNSTTTIKAIMATDSLNYKYEVVEAENQSSFLNIKRNNNVIDRQVMLHNNYNGNKGQNWQFGYHFTNYNVSHLIFEDDRRGYKNEDTTSTADIHAFYAQYQKPIENKIGVQAGIRLSTNNIEKGEKNRRPQIEPRVRLDYKLSKSLSIHSSFGMYHQLLSQIEFFRGDRVGFETPLWELANEQLNIQQSEMYQAGLIFSKDDWVIDVQAYQRKVKGISGNAYNIDAVPNQKLSNGKSNIVGIDLLIKKRIGKFRSWLSYSLSKADLTFNINNSLITFPSNYDQRHILNWNNQVRLNNWHFSAGYKICSGLPYTNISKKLYSFQKFVINADNFEHTSTVNLSANYQLTKTGRKWKAHFTASILNLFDADNVYEISYLPQNTEENDRVLIPVEKAGIPFTPNFSVRFEW